MATKKELLKQARGLGLEIKAGAPEEDVAAAISAKIKADKAEEAEKKAKMSGKDRIAAALKQTQDILTKATPTRAKIKKGPEYDILLANQIELINGQLNGHSIGKDVRANLMYELSFINTGNWDPAITYRRPNKKLTGAALIPAATPGKMAYAK